MLACLSLITISGCSDSTKDAEALPELITAVDFPYIKNNSLYAFDPETGESEPLLSIESNFILALDTDLSNKNTDADNNQIFEHTATAEYFAYADNKKIYLFDVSTRKNHLIYDFEKEQFFNSETQEIETQNTSFICDIQKVVTWDEESRLAKKELYKDELSVYVKTSSRQDCTEEDSPFNYWQIQISESEKTYTRRRNSLLEHTQEHAHFHDHDDEKYIYAGIHSHDHALETGELDENNEPFDQNNHLHSHTHIHDFLYADEHQHELLSKEEVDTVHNNLKYQEIKFETHRVLVGHKTSFESLDEALMYSGKPILDIPNRTFGYLGFNTKEKSYKFYIGDPDSKVLNKALLWQYSDDDFSFSNSFTSLSDIEKLSPKHNRFSTFSYANKNIWIISNNKIYFFTLDEVFDDDESEARTTSFNNPIFESNINNPPLYLRTQYNESNKAMLISENLELWIIDFSDTRPSSKELVKRFNETDLSQISSNFISNRIYVEKKFITEDSASQSIILIENSGLEDFTVIAKTTDSITTFPAKNSIIMNIREATSQNRIADYYSLNLNILEGYFDSLWSKDTTDYRNYLEKSAIALLASENTQTEQNSITDPYLSLVNENLLSQDTEFFGKIPDNISNANNIIIFSDLFGYAEVTDANASTKSFFFSNVKSSFNFDNEFEEMKPLTPPTE